MDFNILKTVNLYIRKKRPMFPDEKICSVFQNNQLVELGFLSKRCRNDQSGTCIMCDYGATEQTYSTEQYLSEMEYVLSSISPDTKRLLLCTNGSFLDEYQIPAGLFRAILKRAAETSISNFEIETHYLDVTPEKLAIIKEELASKSVTIEMGLETINPIYQDRLIMKHIELDRFEKAIRMVQDHGFAVDLNIMFGLPFLTLRELLEDTRNTIIWSHEHGCHSVVFPINIKPYTLLWHMFQSGVYHPLSSWSFLLLLNSLDKELLSNITLAWYGNREENYGIDSDHAVLPKNCPLCVNELSAFYQQFMDDYDENKRKQLLQEYLNHPPCACLNETVKQLQSSQTGEFEQRYHSYVDLLRKEYTFLFD